MNTKDSNSLSSKNNEANSTQPSSERRLSLNLSRFNARINSLKEEATIQSNTTSQAAKHTDQVKSLQSTAQEPHSSTAAPRKILSLIHHNKAATSAISDATALKLDNKTNLSAQQYNTSKAPVSPNASIAQQSDESSSTTIAAKTTVSSANNQAQTLKLDAKEPTQQLSTAATAQTKDAVMSKDSQDAATNTSSESQSIKSAENSTSTTNQEANDTKPSEKVSTVTVKDNKGKKTPPWMAKYQKENDVASAQQNTATSKHDTQSKHGKSNLTSVNKSAALENEGNNNAAVYHPNNFLSLDFLNFQRSFDAIDSYLDQLLDNNQELLNLEIANGKVAKYDVLSLEKDFVNNFTSKKNKASFKEQEQQMNDAISNYLRFKYRGVFKSVCLYNIFCEQLRLKMFEQLQQQCHNYSNLNMGNVSNELQSFLDLIEPVEVAANKLMRLTMIEDKLKLGYLYDFNLSLKSYLNSSRDCSSISDERVTANTGELNSIVTEKLPNIVNAGSFWDFVEDAQHSENTNQVSSGNSTQLEQLVDKSVSDKLVQFVGKSASDKLAAHCPFSNKILSDHEFLDFIGQFSHKPNYSNQCEDAALLNSMLFTFDGFIPSEREPHVFDDCAFNTGILWINDLYNHKNLNGTVDLCTNLFARLRMFAQSREEQYSLFAFADADQCVQKDRLYINNCLNGTFTRNFSQMKLISRQISLLRMGMAVHCNCADQKEIPYNFECAGALVNNDFACVVRFILDLNQTERFIFKEMLSQISTPVLTLSANKLAEQINKTQGFKDSASQISDVQVISFCGKLRNSVLVELLSINKPSEDEHMNYAVDVHVLPVLFDNINNAQRVLNMINTVASLEHRMNQELHYLSPALSKIFECSDTLSSNSQTCDEYNTKLQNALSDEALFTLIRNRLLKKYPKLSGTTFTSDDFNDFLATLERNIKEVVGGARVNDFDSLPVFVQLSTQYYPTWKAIADRCNGFKSQEADSSDDDDTSFNPSDFDFFDHDEDDLSEIVDKLEPEQLWTMLAKKLTEHLLNEE